MIEKYNRCCPECKDLIYYKSKRGLLNSYDKKSLLCKPCKQKSYKKNCPTCNKIVTFKSRGAYRVSVNRNFNCKSCSSKISGKEFIKKWENKIGLNLRKYTFKKIERIKSFWSRLSDKEKLNFYNKSESQKKHYFSHIKHHNRMKLKKAFIKYKGKNHWTTRPYVLNKIIKSCEKYKGKNHWMNRPETYNKFINTLRNKSKNKN